MKLSRYTYTAFYGLFTNLNIFFYLRNYTDLVKCYREAATPCIQDPTFSQSPWEVLFGQVKTVCLSTPGENIISIHNMLTI